MKYCMSILLAFVFALMQTCAFAEKTGDVLDSVSGFFSDALEEAKDVADSVKDEAANAAGDAVEWAEDGATKAWEWAGQAAGDVWDWSSDAALEMWEWSDEAVDKACAWSNETAAEIKSNLETWVNLTGEGALDTLHDVFDMLAAELGVASDKAAEIWDMVMDYAQAHNITPLVLAKLTIAIMIRIALGDVFVGDIAGDYITDTLKQWFADFNIESNEDAEDALASLQKSVEESFDTTN